MLEVNFKIVCGFFWQILVVQGLFVIQDNKLGIKQEKYLIVCFRNLCLLIKEIYGNEFDFIELGI